MMSDFQQRATRRQRQEACCLHTPPSLAAAMLPLPVAFAFAAAISRFAD